MSTLLRYASYLFAAGFGFFAFASGRQLLARLRKRNTSGLSSKGGSSLLRLYGEELLQNGLSITMPLAKALASIKIVSALAGKLADSLSKLGYRTSVQTLLSLVSCGAILFACILWAMTGSLAIGVVAALCLPFGIAKLVDFKQGKELAQIKETLPETIALFERCSTTGNTLQQMFAEAAQECEGPLKGLFAKISLDLQVGGSIEDALEFLRAEAPADELKFLAIALSIQHQTGGSLAHILQSASKTAQSKIELERKLQAQTAQARLSLRIVSLLPFFLLIALSVLSPGFTDPFFSSAVGLAMLCLALMMQAAGIMATKHILKEAQ